MLIFYLSFLVDLLYDFQICTLKSNFFSLKVMTSWKLSDHGDDDVTANRCAQLCCGLRGVAAKF